ncbi:alpha/beta fold hydrolase [Kitasatospora sp. NPDC089797]|uniref:alpha/beta fold hydrolase n=1 Tax=Kitasatospora sp. NPDC089797 TaxID=3155298 RepID=UPI0034192B0B
MSPESTSHPFPAPAPPSSAPTPVPVDGGTLHVRRQGRHGPALVLVHYWGGSARTWDALVRHLPPDRATVRYDQRGWGRSRALPGPHHLEQLTEDLLAVTRGLRLDHFVLVGHSMGGKVCQLAAARRPEGLAGLVLVAPAPPRPAPTATPDHGRGLARAYDTAESAGHALDHVLTAAPLPPAVRAAAVRDSLAADTPAREEWPLHGLAADITAACAGIRVPTLVLTGRHDRVEPADLLRTHLLPHLPHARLTTVPDAGHLLPLEAPAVLAAAVESFTAGLPAPSPAGPRNRIGGPPPLLPIVGA